MTVTSEAKTSVPRNCSNSCVVVPNNRGVSSPSQFPISVLAAAGHSLLVEVAPIIKFGAVVRHSSDSTEHTAWGRAVLKRSFDLGSVKRSFDRRIGGSENHIFHTVCLQSKPKAFKKGEMAEFFDLSRVYHVVCPKLGSLVNVAGEHENGPCDKCTWRTDVLHPELKKDTEEKLASRPVVAFVQIPHTEGSEPPASAGLKLSPIELAASIPSTWSQLFDSDAYWCLFKKRSPVSHLKVPKNRRIRMDGLLWKLYSPAAVKNEDRKSSNNRVWQILLDFAERERERSKKSFCWGH